LVPASNSLTTLDSTGSVGYHTSITLGADGLGLISYYDNTSDQHDLKYAFWNNSSGWPVRTCEWILEGTLNQPGNYDITVKVTDKNGGIGTAVTTILGQWVVYLAVIFR
jgi:hypothetical protein